MTEANISVDQGQFSCSVCLDLLRDPVTIPCGHSYCKRCISDYWNQESIYRCPLCKQTFRPRPVLGKNVVIAEMVEKLKAMSLRSAPVPPPRRRYAHTGSGDVQCDSCTGNKQKAVKSCLKCRSSYCQIHLEQHESLFRGNRHSLMEATGRLQEMICPQHDKMLEIYCRSDQRCICMLCLVDEHRDHDTVSTAAARTEKQKRLEERGRNIQTTIQQREKDLKQLRDAVASHKRSAQTAEEAIERIFTELIRSFEKRRTEVKQLIRDQERVAVNQAEERLARQELELDDLKWKETELKQFLNTDDHTHFLQNCPSVSLSGSTDDFTFSSHPNFDEVVKSVSQLRDKLQQFCTDEIESLSETVKTVQVIVPSLDEEWIKAWRAFRSAAGPLVFTPEQAARLDEANENLKNITYEKPSVFSTYYSEDVEHPFAVSSRLACNPVIFSMKFDDTDLSCLMLQPSDSGSELTESSAPSV